MEWLQQAASSSLDQWSMTMSNTLQMLEHGITKEWITTTSSSIDHVH